MLDRDRSATVRARWVSVLQPARETANLPTLGCDEARLSERAGLARIFVSWSTQADECLLQKLSRAIGTDTPAAGMFECANNVHCLWLSPLDWLVVLPDDNADDLVRELHLASAQYACVIANATSGLPQMSLSGPSAADVLNKGCAIDFAKFMPGNVTRCRFAAANLVIQQIGETEFQLFWDYSLTEYFWTWFEHAIAEIR